MKLLHISLFLSFSSLLSCQEQKPNIVFFFTDDLDEAQGGSEPLIKTRSWIASQGVTFTNSFVNVPICCPSRSSTLTGLYQHNTGVVNNTIDGNCSGPDWQAGPELETYATALQGNGYETFYAGKYLNRYGNPEVGGIAHVPPGWSYWRALAGNSRYYNYSLSIDGIEEPHGDDYEADYMTDVIGRKSIEFIDDYVGNNKQPLQSRPPFLMVLSFSAPHAPFTPAPQYATAYANTTSPRTPAFNFIEDPSMRKHWFVDAQPRPLDDESISYVDEIYRDRLRTVMSVDDVIDEVMDRLDQEGLLTNTYVLFTSDHGFHNGQFGMHYDKRQPYEFDLRVPLYIRGPEVFINELVDETTINIDLFPTFLDMAGLPIPDNLDGQSFLPFIKPSLPASKSTRTSFLVTYTGEYGEAIDPECLTSGAVDENMQLCDIEFDCRCQDSRNNTFECIRSKSTTQDDLYCQFLDDENFVEMYNIKLDEYQLSNLALSLTEEEHQYYQNRIETLLTCRGKQCLI